MCLLPLSSVLVFPDQLSDFTYHLLNVMQEAENDPNERNNLKLLTPNHYVWVILDLFMGKCIVVYISSTGSIHAWYCLLREFPL